MSELSVWLNEVHVRHGFSGTVAHGKGVVREWCWWWEGGGGQAWWWSTVVVAVSGRSEWWWCGGCCGQVLNGDGELLRWQWWEVMHSCETLTAYRPIPPVWILFRAYVGVVDCWESGR